MADTAYCPSCGETVETLALMRGGVEEKGCSFCGLLLREGKDDEPVSTYGVVLSADDMPFICDRVASMMMERKLATEVITSENGEVFLEKLARRFAHNDPVDLVILDVQMPILSGVHAAVSLRALEKAYKRTSLVPIIFFTANRCDATFQKVLKYCHPATYLNKGAGGDTPTEDFAERLYHVVRIISEGGL